MDIFNNAQKAWLLLEDGTLYEGYGLGCAEDTVGELVFNTSVVGYQEILTDPANANNIVVETFPLTGNYGVNREHGLQGILYQLPLRGQDRRISGAEKNQCHL